MSGQEFSTHDAALAAGAPGYVEHGFYVFTSAYHRKRGYCCKNGCRHCPFAEDETEITAT